MQMIELQLKLLGDKIRNEVFAKALEKMIRPGQTTIADIGSGTGFLSFLASQFGAKECYLYEADSEIFELSKKLAKLNKIKNCHFVNAHSTDIARPPRADIVVSETLGNYALEENIIENIEDAKRFLKPGGEIIPCGLEQFVAPVISPRITNEINVWDNVGFGLNLAPAGEAALNNMYVFKITPADLLKHPAAVQKWDCLNFYDRSKSVRGGTAKWKMAEDKKIYGFAVFWNCIVAPGIELSTSPYGSPTHWDQIFLPLTSSIETKKGDDVEITIKSDSRYEVGIVLTWETRLIRHGKIIQTVKMDTRKGA